MQNNIPWIEKYRPVHFDDIVLDPLNKQFFKNIMEKRYFPNLLFYGPPGTGKTTTIINLIHEFQNRSLNKTNSTHKNKENVIHLNASDERGIDIIRNQINQFVKSSHLFESGLKFVILDEVDYMTKNAQQALKSLLQMCRSNVRFCLICNYISKIEESLQHEFVCVRFNQLPKKDISQFIQTITELENVSITPDDIETIQHNYQSDIRSMINFIQLNSYSSDSSYPLDRSDLSEESVFEKNSTSAIFLNPMNTKIICNENWKHIHHLLLSSNTTMDERKTERYIHDISIQYNIDKRNILNTYFNYVIRNYPEIIGESFLTIAENIIHSTDDIPIKHVLRYFCANLAAYYRSCMHTTSSMHTYLVK